MLRVTTSPAHDDLLSRRTALLAEVGLLDGDAAGSLTEGQWDAYAELEEVCTAIGDDVWCATTTTVTLRRPRQRRLPLAG